MNATEKRRMPAETMDRLSCVQKLNQPICLQDFAARDRDFLAASDTAGLISKGSTVSFAASTLLPCKACFLCHRECEVHKHQLAA